MRRRDNIQAEFEVKSDTLASRKSDLDAVSVTRSPSSLCGLCLLVRGTMGSTSRASLRGCSIHWCCSVPLSVFQRFVRDVVEIFSVSQRKTPPVFFFICLSCFHLWSECLYQILLTPQTQFRLFCALCFRSSPTWGQQSASMSPEALCTLLRLNAASVCRRLGVMKSEMSDGLDSFYSSLLLKKKKRTLWEEQGASFTFCKGSFCSKSGL